MSSDVQKQDDDDTGKCSDVQKLKDVENCVNPDDAGTSSVVQTPRVDTGFNSHMQESDDTAVRPASNIERSDTTDICSNTNEEIQSEDSTILTLDSDPGVADGNMESTNENSQQSTASPDASETPASQKLIKPKVVVRSAVVEMMTLYDNVVDGVQDWFPVPLPSAVDVFRALMVNVAVYICVRAFLYLRNRWHKQHDFAVQRKL